MSKTLEKSKSITKDKYTHDILDDLITVASATECTGLMQIPPTSIEEAEAYGDIYAIPMQVNTVSKKHKHK